MKTPNITYKRFSFWRRVHKGQRYVIYRIPCSKCAVTDTTFSSFFLSSKVSLSQFVTVCCIFCLMSFLVQKISKRYNYWNELCHLLLYCAEPTLKASIRAFGSHAVKKLHNSTTGVEMQRKTNSTVVFHSLTCMLSTNVLHF